MNIWWINLIIYFILYVVFTQYYKIATKSCKNDGALTVLVQLLGGLSVLLFIPFFKITFPSDIKVYLFLGLAIIFYAITDRINTTARKGTEVSTYSILGQLSTVFVIMWGIIFFKEQIVLKKIIGSILILLGNVFVIYKKGKFELNKYVLLTILGNISMSIAITIDVGISEQFNMPIYVAATLIIPALIIIIAERIKPKEIINEFKLGNKTAILVVGATWGTMILQMLRTYQYGDVTTIAPLCSITTILNVFVAYFLLKEKNSLWKKVIAALIAMLGIVLIKI